MPRRQRFSRNQVCDFGLAIGMEAPQFSFQNPVSIGDALVLAQMFEPGIDLILGVVPLVIGTGAGAEMRQALGTAVFFGMLGVTFFGLIFTPVFYVFVRWIGSARVLGGGPQTQQLATDPQMTKEGSL